MLGARRLHQKSEASVQSKSIDQRVWINGQLATAEPSSSEELTQHRLPTVAVVANDVNLIVISTPARVIDGAFKLRGKEVELSLSGRWQFTFEDGAADFSSLPLPAKFGMGPDVLFAP